MKQNKNIQGPLLLMISSFTEKASVGRLLFAFLLTPDFWILNSISKIG